jgi:hypothetical protein
VRWAPRGISTRRARHLRAIVQTDRCSVRPSIRHSWIKGDWVEIPIDVFTSESTPTFLCTKCGAVDDPSDVTAAI